MKKEGKNKPYFRSAAKRASYDYIETKLKSSQRALRDNKWKLIGLNKEQRDLKADVAALHQLMQEFKK